MIDEEKTRKLCNNCGILIDGKKITELSDMYIAYCKVKERSDSYKYCLKSIKDYLVRCKELVETGDEIILYTVINKIKEVLNEDDN